MTRPAVAVALGLAAATAYGVASSLQHREAGHVQASNPFAPGLLVSLSKRPGWRLAMVADISAVACQGVALRFGAVILVQLFVVGALPLGVVLSSLRAHIRTSSRDVFGLLLCTGGLALSVPATTGLGLGHPAGAGAWTAATSIVAASSLGLVALARSRRVTAPLSLGVAAGITGGAGSVLLAVCAVGINNPVGLFRTAAPYAAVVCGLATLSLTQSAFQTGTIGAPLAALSITEPAAAVVLALVVLHQHLPGSATTVIPAAIGATAACCGVLLLAYDRSVESATNALVVQTDGGVMG